MSKCRKRTFQLNVLNAKVKESSHVFGIAVKTAFFREEYDKVLYYIKYLLLRFRINKKMLSDLNRRNIEDR